MRLFGFGKKKKEEGIFVECTGDGFSKRNAQDKKRPCKCKFLVDPGKNLVFFEKNVYDGIRDTYSTQTGGFSTDNYIANEVAAVVCPECGSITLLSGKNIVISDVDADYARMNNTVDSARSNGVKPE